MIIIYNYLFIIIFLFMLIKNSRTLLLNSKFSINFGRNFSQHTKTVLYTTRMSSSSSKTNNLKVSPGSSEILNDSSESSTSTSPASPSSTTSTSSSSSPSFFFKQFINLSAIQSLSLAVENPSILIPNHHYSSVLDIDLKNLKSNGVKYLVFDKDNTLCYCYSSTFAPGVDAFINEAKQIFGEKSIAILSNSSGSNDDKDYKSAKKIEDSLNLSVIKHKKKKPGCLDDVSLFSIYCSFLIIIFPFYYYMF